MNTLFTLFASTATLFVIFTNQADSSNFMQNGKEYDDKFYAMFSEGAPVKDIIKLAVSWNAEKQLDHFKQMYHHIQQNDDKAQYAQEIVNGSRIALQKSLDQVGFEKKISLEQYLLGTYQIQNGMKSEVEQDVLEALEKLDHFSNEELERLLDEGEREEVNWELEHLYPYKIVPKKVEKTDSTPKSQEAEDSSVSGPQPNESDDKLVQESTESVEDVVPKPEAESSVEEEKESVEEVIAEPEQAQEVSEPKESEVADSNQEKMSQEV